MIVEVHLVAKVGLEVTLSRIEVYHQGLAKVEIGRGLRVGVGKQGNLRESIEHFIIKNL